MRYCREQAHSFFFLSRPYKCFSRRETAFFPLLNYRYFVMIELDMGKREEKEGVRVDVTRGMPKDEK